MPNENISAFDPAKAASEHAGRELVAGCGPWLREADRFYLSVEGNDLDEKDSWAWIQAHRPDLAAAFSSLEEMHRRLAKSRWLSITNDLGLFAEVVREQGPISGYTYDWETVETIKEEISDEGTEEGEIIQELQLRAPSGEVIHSEARRIFRYRINSHPCGNYQVVVNL